MAPGSAINRRLTKLIAAAGGRKITVQDLRHTHASILLRDGVPLNIVSLRLGHADSGITERVYAHYLPGDDRQASGVIAVALAV